MGRPAGAVPQPAVCGCELAGGQSGSQSRSRQEGFERVRLTLNSTVRTILFWLLMILLAVVLWKMASTGGQSAHEDEPSYTNFLAKVQGGSVKEVTIYLSPNSAELQGEYRDGSKFRGVTIANTAIPDVTKALQDHNVLYNYKEVKNADWLTFLVNFAPLILLVLFWVFMMKQMQAGGK